MVAVDSALIDAVGNWEASQFIEQRCGACGRTIPPGVTYYKLAIRTRRALLRCIECAKPFVEVNIDRVRDMVKSSLPSAVAAPLTSTRVLAHDFRVRQTGEREPGEDDA